MDKDYLKPFFATLALFALLVLGLVILGLINK